MKIKRLIPILSFVICTLIFVSCGTPTPTPPTIDLAVLLNGYETCYIGEELPVKDFMFKFSYSNNSEKTVQINDVKVTNFDKNLLGKQTLYYTFTYDNKTFTLQKDVTVVEHGNEVFDDELICVCSAKETTRSLNEINNNGKLDNWRTIILTPNESFIANKLTLNLEFPNDMSSSKLYMQVDYSYYDADVNKFIYSFDYAKEITDADSEITIYFNNLSVDKYNEENYAGIALSFYDFIDLKQDFLDSDGNPNNSRYGNHNPNVNFKITTIKIN